MKKKVISIFLIIIQLTIISSCYDAREIDDVTYIIAIGADKGPGDTFKFTFQYLIPGSAPGGAGGTGGGESSNITNVSILAPSLMGALTILNELTGKQANVSHTVLTVTSEELSKKGVSAYAREMRRNKEFRPNTIVTVSRGSAEDYLKSINLNQESDPTKFYQLIFESKSLTGFNTGTNIFEFYGRMTSKAISPVADLVGVGNISSSNELSTDASTYKEKDHVLPLEGDYKAGDIPQTGNQNGELMGIAVFDGDKMVGELDGNETMSYLMIIGEFKRGILTLSDPKVKEKLVSLIIKQRKKPQIQVKMKNGSPDIKVKIDLEADIVAIHSDVNYETIENLPILEKTGSAFIKKDTELMLNKVASDYKSDIFGFGKYMRKQFLTWDEWSNFNWLSKFQYSNFKVDVDLKIRRPGLMIRTAPVESSGEEGSD